MSLYNKYRPSSWDDITGAKNRGTVETLRKLIEGIPPHAFLLHGPRGCGKTTTGRIIAKELGCEGDDFREVDSADFRGIDTIREIRRGAEYKGLCGKYRVWLLDECDKLSGDAQTALLKLLEEPPDHAYFILCTTDPEKLLPTIRSRCSQFIVYQLADIEMLKLLNGICVKENQRLPRDVLTRIVELSKGHCRDALQMLEQALANPEAALDSFEEVERQSIELCRALTKGSNWSAVSTILTGMKDEDPERVRRAVLGYCTSILVKERSDTAAAVMEQFLDPFYDSGFPELVYACYSVVCGADPGV